MALINCPRCGQPAVAGGIPAWQIIVSICFFPIGMLALLAGRDPSRCQHCGNVW